MSFLSRPVVSGWVLLLVGVAPAGAATAAEVAAKPDPAAISFFEKKIRPLLSQQCYKCHSTTSEKLKGGLYLDSRDGMLKGGDTGPSLEPGHPEHSLLISAVKWSDKDLQMPPKNKLSDTQIADLVKWVQMGAPWPNEQKPIVTMVKKPKDAPEPTAAKRVYGDYDKLRKEHWAWQPVKSPSAPAVKNAAWAKCDVDKFLLAKMEEKGLHPIADADRATLIRRLSYDLWGLPPTPEDVDAFVRDSSPDAYEKLVDRYLASPRFGERWGRHWLDVARYAESTGSARNVPYQYAWRYRDYVIDAFNEDKPYDRFIQEQIAGDLMSASNPHERNEQLAATGFLAIGVKDLNEKNRMQYVMDCVDEQIDVTSRAILGMTVSCARCHDHKFDPIPTADYYSLAGIFKSTEILSGVGKRRGAGKNYSMPEAIVKLEPDPSAAAAEKESSSAQSAGRDEAKIQSLTADLEAAKKQVRYVEQMLNGAKKGKGKAGPQQVQRAKRILDEKQEEVRTLTASLEAAKKGTSTSASVGEGGGLAVGVKDASPSDCRICVRGDVDNLGAEVPRGFISLVHFDGQPKVESGHSGRRELAQWMTSKDNPLTARVMVNRIWGHLFGQGIVRTVDNFGSTGEAPTHPELLDALATRFVKDGWSVKKMIRTVVLSRAYQLSGTWDAADGAIDPGDHYVWRMQPRRLEAEAIRDAMLLVSGKLDVSRPQGSPVEHLPVNELRAFRVSNVVKADGNNHRSVYLPILRDLLPESLDVFDFAEPTMETGAREVTTVATQALYMMNNTFVGEQAKHFAERVMASPAKDDAAKVELAYRMALSRQPTPAERARAVAYVSSFAREASGAVKGGVERAKAEAWGSFCQAMFGSAEFRYVE